MAKFSKSAFVYLSLVSQVRLKLFFITTVTLFLLGCESFKTDIHLTLAEEAKFAFPLQIYLVRHAEKELNTQNPPLNQAGLQRSLVLLETLKDVRVDKIYSTDYKRTLQTVSPLANDHHVNIQLYDPRQLRLFATELMAEFGILVVVGHSNTTPELVEMLGGDSVSAINEAYEYDRLYHLVFTDDGEVISQLLRYGKPYIKPK